MNIVAARASADTEAPNTDGNTGTPFGEIEPKRTSTHGLAEIERHLSGPTVVACFRYPVELRGFPMLTIQLLIEFVTFGTAAMGQDAPD